MFNISDLYLFEGFDEEVFEVLDLIQQYLKGSVEVTEDVLDVKEIKSPRGNQYRRFLMKWLSKLASESTWIAEDELQKIDPKMYVETLKVFSPESSFPCRGEGCRSLGFKL